MPHSHRNAIVDRFKHFHSMHKHNNSLLGTSTIHDDDTLRNECMDFKCTLSESVSKLLVTACEYDHVLQASKPCFVENPSLVLQTDANGALFLNWSLFAWDMFTKVQQEGEEHWMQCVDFNDPIHESVFVRGCRFIVDELLPLLLCEKPFTDAFGWKSSDIEQHSRRENLFREHYGQLLNDLEQPLDFVLHVLQLHVLRDHEQQDIERCKTDSFLAFSILSTIVERLVGSIFLSQSGGEKPILRTLSELLSTQEIHDVLGGTTVFIVRCLIGPPIALNLRNVIWHGFLSDADPFRPEFTSLLFLIYVSIAKRAHDHFSAKSIGWISKPLIGSKAQREQFDFGRGLNPFGDEATRQNRLLMMDDFRDLIKSSYLVLPGRERLIVRALEEYAVNGDYLNCLVLLLPQLEMCLRVLYVSCNEHLPHEMVQARSRALFTTFDIILANYLENDSSGDCPMMVNRVLCDELGERLAGALHDHLFHYDGSRIRESIAHGEMTNKQVLPYVTDRVVGVFIALLMKYDIRRPWHDGSNNDEYFQRFSKPIQRCFQFHHDFYVSCFHPKSLLVQELSACFRIHANMDAAVVHRYWEHEQLNMTQIQEVSGYECAFSRKDFMYTKKKKKTEDGNMERIDDALLARFLRQVLTINTRMSGINNVFTRNHATLVEVHRYLQLTVERTITTRDESGRKRLFLFSHHGDQSPHPLLELNSAENGDLPVRYIHNCLALYELHIRKIYGDVSPVMETFNILDPTLRQQYMSNLALCRLILQELQISMQVYVDKQQQLTNLLLQRRARTPHRKLLGVYVHLYPITQLMFQLVMLWIDIELADMWHHVVRSTHDQKWDYIARHRSLLSMLTAISRIRNTGIQDGKIGAAVIQFVSYLLTQECLD